jgi:predicted small secreted protein
MTNHRFLTVVALIAALFAASCANTVRGVGRDVNQTADAVEDSIN